jgi:carboxymethylenebutenolidase
MSEFAVVTASDGHQLSAYIAKPTGEPLGGVVVIQEIFGVNKSIRDVADHYAKLGYIAIAPALFDRFERNLELGYGEQDMKKAFGLYGQLSPDTQLLDVAAAFQHIQGQGKGTAVVGFCYGGLLAWLSATRAEKFSITPTCTVGYYAGGIGKVAAETPVCPVQLHFGKDDDHIGADQIDPVRAAHPDVEIYLYEDAGHAFANPARPTFVPAAAKVADERAAEFLKKHIG